MGFMNQFFRKANKKTRLGSVKGGIYALQPPVGVRKENGVFLAVRRGIAKTEDEKGRKKSRARLRREKDAMWLARVRRKQFEGVA